MQEKTVTSSGTKYITFLYNGEGLTGFVYDNTLYTYRKNLFGDIIAVYQGSTKVAEYAYDAYGKCTIILNTAGIATINPFRYRSSDVILLAIFLQRKGTEQQRSVPSVKEGAPSLRYKKCACFPPFGRGTKRKQTPSGNTPARLRASRRL